NWMRGAEHAELAADAHGRADALSWIVCALALGPTPVAEAIERCDQILAELGVSMHSAVAHYDGFVALLAGDAAGAEAVLRTGYEQLEAMGERALLATTAGLLARALIEQGRDGDAWAYLDIADRTAASDDLSAHMVSRTQRAR